MQAMRVSINYAITHSLRILHRPRTTFVLMRHVSLLQEEEQQLGHTVSLFPHSSCTGIILDYLVSIIYQEKSTVENVTIPVAS
jgi:hypothetical protein